VTKVIPIIPKRNPFATAADLARAINNAQDLAADDIKAQFEQVWSTWEHKPTVTVNKDGYDRRVEVTGENARIFRYVDEGTRPHTIVPRRRKRLAFSSKFGPKTRPGSLTSGGGSKGGVDTFVRFVAHPGSKPRNFTKNIIRKNKSIPSAYMRRELAKAAR
jgi:hypothetical protein